LRSRLLAPRRGLLPNAKTLVQIRHPFSPFGICQVENVLLLAEESVAAQRCMHKWVARLIGLQPLLPALLTQFVVKLAP